MASQISIELFRSYGTHALKKISIEIDKITLVVAPWEELDKEATAVFERTKILYIEAEGKVPGESLDYEMPWDMIRLDSQPIADEVWEFGLCCDNFIIGFSGQWPEIAFE
ncbi:hypothetical protein [Vibrio paucivorans]|uniref:Uncharacterized protein n=1 Tax=Vibrio paucivorans TaxID=2829489 RepID=A0A9X3CHX4_9VIBR|nr:hypothetical protein [Vibrio paucivorans]MCW8336173.1 hypothetical protein [Vibrio paucivorans]